MHPSVRYAIALMFCQHARQEARVQFRRVALINRYCRGTNRANKALDDFVDFYFKLLGESPAFWAQELRRR